MPVTLPTITLFVDADDERDIHAAIAHFQTANHAWEGALLGEGQSNTSGAIIGEICRQWLDARGALHQEGQNDA